MGNEAPVFIALIVFTSIAVSIRFIANAVIRMQEMKLKHMHGGGQAQDARLERIEQAVDAIAIEVERISEGQRFTTKLLSERVPSA